MVGEGVDEDMAMTHLPSLLIDDSIFFMKFPCIFFIFSMSFLCRSEAFFFLKDSDLIDCDSVLSPDRCQKYCTNRPTESFTTFPRGHPRDLNLMRIKDKPEAEPGIALSNSGL